jgi:Family of unknown function (DUF5343)
MSVPTSYMVSTKNVPKIFGTIQDAGVPERFSYEFLKQLGFTSSADRGVIALMKALRFLDESSSPTDRYRRFRDKSMSGAVMAEALRDAYGDLFKVNENANAMAAPALKEAFKRISGKGEAVAVKMAMTFKSLSLLADWSVGAVATAAHSDITSSGEPVSADPPLEAPPPASASPPTADHAANTGFTPTLRHDIHIHLPVADVKVYDAIFRSLRENFG